MLGASRTMISQFGTADGCRKPRNDCMAKMSVDRLSQTHYGERTCMVLYYGSLGIHMGAYKPAHNNYFGQSWLASWLMQSRAGRPIRHNRQNPLLPFAHRSLLSSCDGEGKCSATCSAY